MFRRTTMTGCNPRVNLTTGRLTGKMPVFRKIVRILHKDVGRVHGILERMKEESHHVLGHIAAVGRSKRIASYPPRRNRPPEKRWRPLLKERQRLEQAISADDSICSCSVDRSGYTDFDPNARGKRVSYFQ